MKRLLLMTASAGLLVASPALAQSMGSMPGMQMPGMQMPANLGQGYTARFRAIFPAVAKEKHCTLIPFLLAGVGGNPALNQADQIHPTAAGQQKLAETVWHSLSPLL